MSKEIQEYILNYYRYRSFSPTDLARHTNAQPPEISMNIKSRTFI